MGDARFDKPYKAIKEALRPAELIHAMSSEDVIAALASSSRENDPFIANVLATEAQNRVRREATAMEQLGHGVYVVDATASVAYINQAAADILQRPAREIVGHPSRDVVHLTDPTLSDKGGDRPEEVALATGRTVETEHGVITLRGHEQQVFVAYSAVPMQREGITTGVVVGFRDITARLHAEDALAQSEARHRQLLDTIPDAILIIDATGRVRYANPAAHELFGQNPDKFVGTMLGIPSVNPKGDIVDVSMAGGTWRRARLRTLSSVWQNERAFLTIYSQS